MTRFITHLLIRILKILYILSTPGLSGHPLKTQKHSYVQRLNVTHKCKHEDDAMPRAICLGRRKMMSHQAQPPRFKRLNHGPQKEQASLPAACLICRVLWPRILPHRHLPVYESSEAKTILRTRARRSE